MREEPNTLFSKNYSSKKSHEKKRSEISELKISIEDSRKRQERKAKENYRKYGTGKYTNAGTAARLSAIPYPNLSNLTPGNKQSFDYGYYERGNTNISILIETGKINEITQMKDLEKTYNEINELYGLQSREVPLSSLLDSVRQNEVLRAIGYNDGKNENISLENLNETIRTCLPYIEGYELGRKVLKSTTKEGRSTKR